MSKQVINRGGTINDPTAETIFAAMGKAKANFDEVYNYRPFNALGPPSGTALAGDSEHTSATGTDDAAALQALITAALASGGVPVVELPARRTYRIGTMIDIPQGGLTIRGLGGLIQNGQEQPATIVWSGSAGGTMFDVNVASENVCDVVFENVTIMGRQDQTNLPATIIKFRGNGGNGYIDSGCMLRNVWLGNCTGDALRLESLATNFLISGGRFNDGIQGYGLYSVGGSITICDNHTWSQAGAHKGWIHIDGSTANNGCDLKLIGCHPEAGAGDMTETWTAAAGAPNPYDRCGVIALTVNKASTHTTHLVTAIGLRYNAPSAVNSRSIFQILAASSDDANMDTTRLVNIQVIGGQGALTSGYAEGNADDQIRLVGGRLHTNYRQPVVQELSGNIGTYHLNVGPPNTGEMGWSYTASQRNYLRLPILLPMTVSQLDAVWPARGMEATITDSTVPMLNPDADLSNFGKIVVGGGSEVVPVIYDGSNWRIG